MPLSLSSVDRRVPEALSTSREWNKLDQQIIAKYFAPEFEHIGNGSRTNLKGYAEHLAEYMRGRTAASSSRSGGRPTGRWCLYARSMRGRLTWPRPAGRWPLRQVGKWGRGPARAHRRLGTRKRPLMSRGRSLSQAICRPVLSGDEHRLDECEQRLGRKRLT